MCVCVGRCNRWLVIVVIVVVFSHIVAVVVVVVCVYVVSLCNCKSALHLKTVYNLYKINKCLKILICSDSRVAVCVCVIVSRMGRRGKQCTTIIIQ